MTNQEIQQIQQAASEYAKTYIHLSQDERTCLKDDFIAGAQWAAQKLQRTPDWSTAPDWANWRAQDSDGKWWLYEKKPVKSKQSWLKTSGEWALDHYMGENWETSLQKRPKNPEQ